VTPLIRLSIALSLALLGASACHKKAPDPQTPTESTTGPAATAAPDEQPEPEPTPDPQPEPTPDCRDDRDCDGYLRCVDATCKVPPAVEGEAVEGMSEVTFVDGDSEVASFKVELAVEPWERSRGLMHRRKMHPDFGMLFVFEEEEVRSFWMKNTIIPLDMVHVDASGDVVGIVHSAEPMTLTPRRTGEPARYVLELNAGVAKKIGLEPGMTMRLENAPDELLPK
jgi:uncharacterized membrane protein (UPF0127 family)